MSIARVTVYAGARSRNPLHERAAQALADVLAERSLGLVYGGGRLGLMGVLADAALRNGVEVIGVIPRAMVGLEVAHDGLDELHIAEDLQARNRLMAELGDAFIALPGGVGTIAEASEMLIWTLLGVHRKPVGLLDVSSYWAPLLAMLDQAVREHYVSGAQRDSLVSADQPGELLRLLAGWRPPRVDERLLWPARSD